MTQAEKILEKHARKNMIQWNQESFKRTHRRLHKSIIESINEALQINDVVGWVNVSESLPKPLQAVWLTNGKGWVCLGCLVESEDGWHWAESNGVIYIENGEIVSECESEDLDVNYWHELPKPPCIQFPNTTHYKNHREL